MQKLTSKFLLLSVTSAICLSAGAAITDRGAPMLTEVLDLPAKQNVASPLLNKNKEAVNFSWKIDANFVPSPADVLSASSESVEYWQNITGSELNKGVLIATSAPGALVRISQKETSAQNSLLQKSLRGIEPLDLEVTSPRGKKLANGNAMSLKASPQTLSDAGSPFPNGTTGFQLKESLGSGNFTLRNNKALSPNAEYVLHVFDKHSKQRLSVTREQSSYKAGDTLTLHGDLTNNHKAMNISSVEGFVVSPRGNVMPLRVQRGVQGQFRADLTLSQKVEYGGLYEAYIDASSSKNGATIKRRVKTAFAVTKSTASMQAISGTMDYGLPVSINVKAAGRYEVRGVMYGTNANGQLTPFMASSTAQWLEHGKRGINLQFDKSIIAASGLSAPYELRHLQLFDQSRMGSLQLLSKAIGITGNTPMINLQPSQTLPAQNAPTSLSNTVTPAIGMHESDNRKQRLREFLR